MNSLRRTALLWMTGLLAIAGLCAFVVAYELARKEAADFLDGQLRQIALNAGEGVADVDAPFASDQQDPEDAFAIAIWSSSGKALRLSPNGIELPRQATIGFSTVSFAGEDWRVYVASDSRRTVQIAQRLAVRQELATTSAVQASAPILVVIPLLWLMIGWALGQLSGKLTRLADSIATRSLDRRDLVPEEETPAEVRPLVAAMNALTGRLQNALDQQRRFISDAAHELRTPLTALQIQVDNLRAEASPEQTGPMSDLDSGLKRASLLVEQLLRLARTDEPIAAVSQQPVDLSDLISSVVARFVPIATARGIDLGLMSPAPIVVTGARAELQMLFDNLIDNAVRYTPPGGVVDVTVKAREGMFDVEILDTGCGVDEANMPRLFDRFFRAAPADIGGSGLGLSIAASVAARHKIKIELANRAGQPGFRVAVSGLLRRG